LKEEEMEKDIPPKPKSFFRKIYNNSKASLKTFRKFQDSLAKEFPGLVNKKKEDKEEKKDERRIQEVYERRIKYYEDAKR
jgi:hypothetical protein